MTERNIVLEKTRGKVIGSFIIAVTLSTVILLMAHPIKYVLYVFGLSLTGLLVLLVFRYHYRFKSTILFSAKIIDCFFIVCSIVVLATNILAIPVPEIKFILSVIVTFFLPGWALLRLLKIDCRFGFGIGLIIVCFAVSLGLSSLIFTSALFLKIGTTAAVFLSVIYVSISSFPLLKDCLSEFREKKAKSYFSHSLNEYNLVDILILVWILLFFIFIISNLYPQMAYVPGNDIVRHLSESERLILAPRIYASEYPWFHSTWASVITLSAPPMWLFQSGIACLSIVLIYSFYIMAKAYLSNIDRRAPYFATIFFFVFSGFGWFYFVSKFINMPSLSERLNLLDISYNASYWDIGIGQSTWLWLWFRPLTLGFTIFFVLLYLMRREDLDKRKYTILISLLILTLSQVHFSELLGFIILIFFLTLFFPSIKLRLRETFISVLIGLAASMALTAAYHYTLGYGYLQSSNQYLYPLAALAGLGYILVRYPRRPKISRPKISFRVNSIILVTSILLSAYSIFLIYWFSHLGFFLSKNVSQLYHFYAVPWELYPMLLGLVGFLALPGIVLVFRKFRSHPIIIFAVLFILIIVFGRIITYINVTYINIGYQERRFIPFVFVSSSILASVVVLRIMDQIMKKKEVPKLLKVPKNIQIVTFLSLLVVGGMLSTLLSVEFQILHMPVYALTGEETSLQSSLKNINPYSTMLTVTNRSKQIGEYTPFGYIIDYYRYQVWPSKSPELPLNVLYVLNSPAIIYLNKQDLKKITDFKYGDGYIASHILKVAPTIKEGVGGKVVQTPTLSPTLSKSDMVLVLPERRGGDVGNSSKSYYYAYDVLSLAGYNYTTAPLSDIDSIKKARILVSPNEEIALKIMEYKSQYNLQYKKLIILNLDGYGQMVDVGSAIPNPLVNKGNESSQWIAIGLGSGKISIPKLIDKNNMKISGQDSLEISVDVGKYKLWQISRLLHIKPLDLTKFDFVKFKWYGRGDGKWYVLQFNSGRNQYFWYRFQDSWSGWKQVILPMQMSDGRAHLLGVTFDKSTKPGAYWSKIIRIDFKTEASNINHEGKFYFGGFAFGKILKSSNIKSISNNQEIQFPTDIDLLPIIPKSNFDTKAYYNGGIPFILHKIYDGYDVFYINIFPVVQTLESGVGDSRAMYVLLGKLLEFSNAQLPKYNLINRNRDILVSGNVAAFNSATVNGNLTLKSSSAIINADASSIAITIDGKNLILNNVSQIVPTDNENVTAKSNWGIINGGYGFYANVSLNQALIHFIGHPAILSLTFKNGSTSIIRGKEFQISLSKSNMLLRQPSVASNGIINFVKFYGYGSFNNRIRVLGQDQKIEGRVSFNTVYSDKFTITHGTAIEGKLESYQPIYLYDEIGSLANLLSLPYMICLMFTLLIIYFVLNHYIFKKKKTVDIG